MCEVVSLDDYRRRHEGLIRCLACKHEWQGFTFVGNQYSECPECKCLRGVFVLQRGAPGNASSLYCPICDCSYFIVLSEVEKIQCASCAWLGEIPFESRKKILE